MNDVYDTPTITAPGSVNRLLNNGILSVPRPCWATVYT